MREMRGCFVERWKSISLLDQPINKLKIYTCMKRKKKGPSSKPRYECVMGSYKVGLLEEARVTVRLDEVAQRLVPVQIRVLVVLLQVPAQYSTYIYIHVRGTYSTFWTWSTTWRNNNMGNTYVRTSSLNLRISRIMRQNAGLTALVFWARRPARPLRLPHSIVCSSPSCSWALTEKDMSESSISTPSSSNHSIMFGYVTCIIDPHIHIPYRGGTHQSFNFPSSIYSVLCCFQFWVYISIHNF